MGWLHYALDVHTVHPDWNFININFRFLIFIVCDIEWREFFSFKAFDFVSLTKDQNLYRYISSTPEARLFLLYDVESRYHSHRGQ